MKTDYAIKVKKMWDDMVVPVVHNKEVQIAAKKIYNHIGEYGDIAFSLGLPTKVANVIGVMHMRESNFDFTKHLANGDPLTADTIHVPKNIMAPIDPPYTFEEGACAAIKNWEKGWNLDLTKYTWDIPNTLWFLEAWNGFGFKNKGINTPYLWSYTQHYDKGYFSSDGVFNPNLVNQQPGCAPVLKSLGYTA